VAENVSVGLLVRLDAKPGREADVESFIQQGLSLVQEEPKTVRRFGVRFGRHRSGSSTRFRTSRDAKPHLSGQVASALQQNVGELFEEPRIERVDVIAESTLRKRAQLWWQGMTNRRSSAIIRL
jgi:hypothetical protein